MAGRNPIEIPAAGTRGSWNPMAGLLGRLARPLVHSQVSRYRKKAGDATPRMMGFPIVLLTTVGARTGIERTHVLGGFADGTDAWIVVASNGGAAAHPQWFVNLARNPDRMTLEVGRRKMHVRPQLLKGEERERALAMVAAIAPRYGQYQLKTDREIPIVRLTAEDPAAAS